MKSTRNWKQKHRHSAMGVWKVKWKGREGKGGRETVSSLIMDNGNMNKRSGRREKEMGTRENAFIVIMEREAERKD